MWINDDQWACMIDKNCDCNESKKSNNHAQMKSNIHYIFGVWETCNIIFYTPDIPTPSLKVIITYAYIFMSQY